MKAVVFPEYGDSSVLELREVEKPTPKDHEVLIQVRASSVNKGDWHIMTGTPFPVRFMVGGPFTPRDNIPGGDVSGVVKDVGKNVKDFKIGDEVFGDISGSGFGGWAEYVCSKTDSLALKPSSMGFSEAASIPMAAGAALQGLRDIAKLNSGMEVLVNGASGGVGMFGVLIAKYMGAKVTAVGQTSKLHVLEELGADHIIDYTKQNFMKSENLYDLVFDCAGYGSMRDVKNVLSENGMYLLVGGDISSLMRILFLGPLLSLGKKKFKNYLAQPNSKDLVTLGEMYEEGQLTPFIGNKFDLADAPQAMRALENRETKGKLIIKID